MLERRWGLAKLLFVGTGLQSDYLDVLVRRGWEDQVSEAGARALKTMGGWHVAELRQMRSTAAVLDLLKVWNGPRIDLKENPLWVIEVQTWDELLKSLPKSQRTPARRTIRRAEEDGVRSVPAGPEEAEQAARRLLALHRESRRGRNIVAERLTAWFESYTLACARRMTERGLGGISEFWRDGEVIVSSFLIFDNDIVVPYIVGASKEATHRYQWSTLFIWDAINIARSRRCSHVSLLTGTEEYKQRWSKEVPYYRITLGRSPLLWRGYLPLWRSYRAYRSLRLRVREYLRSDTTPRWLTNTAKLLRKRDY